ncbi:linear amide C-N hydrolase [Clostridium minihomine]|uniref:linear amide C-N hydrolase n=1 Tax=Clostridium minihomine TaxID=2045012 RepID=UPI000C766A92|nr:choloylglycine hydrolase family protein [Clostridium minihomine]
MCTSITLQSKENETFFGRTMDFSYDIEPQLYVIPKNYVWQSVFNGQRFHDVYSFIAIGQEDDRMMGFFDGVNEKGFAAASLYFAGYAQYETRQYKEKQPVAALDFLHYMLGQCASVNDLEELLPQISLMGVPDPVTQTVAPLHWIATDRSGKCVVIERTEQGTRMYHNPLGVMANSPEFSWHMTNLRNYALVNPGQAIQNQWGNLTLKPFGQGAGTSLLPGGYTSPERFVRTAYFKTHMPTPATRDEAVQSCFHIMSSVSIPKGAVVSSRNTYDYTRYTAFLNTNTCEYYFKTYENSQMATASLWDHYESGTQPIRLGRLDRPVVFEPFGK